MTAERKNSDPLSSRVIIRNQQELIEKLLKKIDTLEGTYKGRQEQGERHQSNYILKCDAGAFYYDVDNRSITNGPLEAHFTKIPNRLLHTLIKNAETFVGNDELIHEVWGKSRSPQNLWVNVSRIKEELDKLSPLLSGQLGNRPNLGYIWEGEVVMIEKSEKSSP